MWGNGRKYFDCIDLHCGGEPARVMFSTNCPPIPGKSMAQKRESMIKSFDQIRRVLLQEPRGYPCQNLNIIFPSEMPGIDWGYIICEQECVYPLFSGHNTICVVTALLETGHIPITVPVTQFNLEAPGGQVHIKAHCKDGRVLEVEMTPPPSYVAASNIKVSVPTLKLPVKLDISFGGMFYAVVQTDSIDELPPLEPQNGKLIAALGCQILKAAQQQHPVVHPINKEYVGPDIIVFHDPIRKSVVLTTGCTETPRKQLRSDTESGKSRVYETRNTVVMQLSSTSASNAESGCGSGMLDRSPCGSGTAAIVASNWSKGLFTIGDTFKNKSIVGSEFVATVKELGPTIGTYDTVMVEVRGRAYISGFNRLVVEPDDPFPEGFTVGDIWS